MEPVVEPVSNVEEEEADEDEGEAEHQQLHPRLVLNVIAGDCADHCEGCLDCADQRQ